MGGIPHKSFLDELAKYVYRFELSISLHALAWLELCVNQHLYRADEWQKNVEVRGG